MFPDEADEVVYETVCVKVYKVFTAEESCEDEHDIFNEPFRKLVISLFKLKDIDTVYDKYNEVLYYLKDFEKESNVHLIDKCFYDV